MKRISILGVTGSIGSSALTILRNHADKLKLVSVSSHSNIQKLIDIVRLYKPDFAVFTDSTLFYEKFGSYEITIESVPVYSGPDVLKRVTSDTTNDIILNAISGTAGLLPSYDILLSGIDLALANKESIVCAGDLLQNIASSTGAAIIPVDSEHSAIFSLLSKIDRKYLESIYITASGGPFLRRNKETWHSITKEEALKHPTWSMGQKISIDSATMANKGLEVIEAHYLFNIPYSKINVLIHPQSVIHSMVETYDGELYAQLGPNDMSLPIMNAIFYPDMLYNDFNRFSFKNTLHISLEQINTTQFPMLLYAYQAGEAGGYFPAIYNFLNEILVNKFLTDKIKFSDIETQVNLYLQRYFKNTDLYSNVNVDSLFLLYKEINDQLA